MKRVLSAWLGLVLSACVFIPSFAQETPVPGPVQGFYTTGGGGSITLVQQNGVSFTNVTANQTFNLTGVTAGNFLLYVACLYEVNGLGGAFANVTDSAASVSIGNKPTPMQLAATDSVGVAVWYSANATSGTHTVGYDPGGSTTGSYGRVMAFEFSNVSTSATVNGTNSQNSTSPVNTLGTGSSGTLGTSTQLVATAMMLETDTNTIGTPSGYTLAYNSNGTLNVGCHVDWKEVAVNTATSATYSWTPNEEVQTVIQAFPK